MSLQKSLPNAANYLHLYYPIVRAPECGTRDDEAQPGDAALCVSHGACPDDLQHGNPLPQTPSRRPQSKPPQAPLQEGQRRAQLCPLSAFRTREGRLPVQAVARVDATTTKHHRDASGTAKRLRVPASPSRPRRPPASIAPLWPGSQRSRGAASVEQPRDATCFTQVRGPLRSRGGIRGRSRSRGAI